MNDQQEIIFTIMPDGTLDINMSNYKGTDCMKELKKIEKELGKVINSKKKAEYFEETKNKIRQQE